MASTSETGHAKNVANFRQLVNYCIGFGPQYDPVKTSIKIPNLETVYSDADVAVKKVNEISPTFIEAVNARQNGFRPLNKLCTRIINALDASDVDDAIVKDARTIVNKIQGNRKSAAPDPQNPSSGQASSSQQSFDLRLDNFHKLKELLSSQPLYTPNEVELQAATIATLYDTLQDLNNTVKSVIVPLNAARIDRNKALYLAPNGLVPLALEVKKYVKSVFGSDHPNFKLVSGIAFRRLRV